MSRFVEAATLARLVETGAARESKRNLPLLRRYETALWLERSTRKAVWTVREGCRKALARRLTEICPDWKAEFAFLRSLDLDPFNPDDIRSLPVLKQKRVARGVINRRNWNAASGTGPKRKARLRSEAVITADWIIRMRPSRGLLWVAADREIDLYRESLTYTECTFPERMWRRFGAFTGTLPETLITCENLGAYIDLPLSPTTMAVYSPGKDTTAVIELLRKLPDVGWVHFGDLDPEGFRIARTIADAIGREARFYIPSFAADYLPGRSFKGNWNDYSGPEHPVVVELIRTRRRIFQEVFMLDPRLAGDLETAAGAQQPRRYTAQ